MVSHKQMTEYFIDFNHKMTFACAKPSHKSIKVFFLWNYFCMIFFKSK